jgi:hypothetical protein
LQLKGEVVEMQREVEIELGEEVVVLEAIEY